jgi:Uncharacterised nucleotidyltransferase
VTPPLDELLRTALPTEQETLVLRAALHDGDSGREAWARAQASVREPLELLRGEHAHLRALGPLLHEGLRRNGAAAEDRGLLTVLRTAAVREQARQATLRGLAAQALEEAAAKGAGIVALKGIALADVAYPNPALRHTHDVDLLLGPGERWLAPASPTVSPHRHLFIASAYRRAEPAMLARTVREQVAGVETPVLAPPDMLVHVCVHALTLGGRHVAHWVPDAWFAARRVLPGGWSELAQTAREAGMALPLWCTLDWLADRLGVGVPGEVIEDLRAAARDAGPLERDTALSFAWAAGRRRSLVRWALLPAPDYLRVSRGARTAPQLAAAYLARPWRFAARRLRGR